MGNMNKIHIFLLLFFNMDISVTIQVIELKLSVCESVILTFPEGSVS